MWDNAQSLRQLSNTLITVSVLLILFGALNYALHLPVFALRSVTLSAAPKQVDVAQIEEVVQHEVRGNFFTVDLDGVRHAFERLPWVRHVSVRIDFPWQLNVELEEHVALARWSDTELVNTHGEVFLADTDEVLPKFIGQPDTSGLVTEMYQTANGELAPLKQKVVQVSLTPRHAWQLRLSNGLEIELGREEAEARLARFVAVYPYSLGRLQRPVNYVDLRYQNGFAAYLPGGMPHGGGGQESSDGSRSKV